MNTPFKFLGENQIVADSSRLVQVQKKYASLCHNYIIDKFACSAFISIILFATIDCMMT